MKVGWSTEVNFCSCPTLLGILASVSQASAITRLSKKNGVLSINIRKTSKTQESFEMKKFITPSVALSNPSLSSCTRTANKTGPLVPYPAVTADIEIGEQVRGEGTRAELLGFIRWEIPGRASFTAHGQQEHDALGGGVVKQSMQSAVYDALEGQPEHFIVDPHFHTVEHNFLVFKNRERLKWWDERPSMTIIVR